MLRQHERIQGEASVPIYILAVALSRVPSVRVYSRCNRFYTLYANGHMAVSHTRCRKIPGLLDNHVAIGANGITGV